MLLAQALDRALVQPVEQCLHCQQDLWEIACLQVERRHMIDLPPKRVVVIEH